MVQIAAGNSEPSVIRFKKTLAGLNGTIAVLQDIKLNNFYREVNPEVLDAAIQEFERSIVQYENYILEAGGEL